MITDFYRLPNIPINHHNGTATRSTGPQPVNILVTGPSAWVSCAGFGEGLLSSVELSDGVV